MPPVEKRRGDTARARRVADRAKQVAVLAYDRVDVDIDLDVATKAAAEGYRARRPAGAIRAAAGAVTQAARSGGVRVRLRDVPRSQSRRSGGRT